MHGQIKGMYVVYAVVVSPLLYEVSPLISNEVIQYRDHLDTHTNVQLNWFMRIQVKMQTLAQHQLRAK